MMFLDLKEYTVVIQPSQGKNSYLSLVYSEYILYIKKDVL